MNKKFNRCWPGYEPTPGKEPYSPGSCKPVRSSQSTSTNEKTKSFFDRLREAVEENINKGK